MTRSILDLTRRFLACIAVLACAGAAFPVSAQGTLNIVAVVNDDVISAFDLGQRVQLTIIQSNLPQNAATQQRIAGSILRRLISEKLHMQEAARLGIELDDAEVEQEIASMETRSGMPAGGMNRFLEQRGIDPEILRERVRAERSWRAVVSALFRNLVTVSDVEVEDILRDMDARKGKTEYLTAEILLAFDNAPRAEVLTSARDLITQIRRGSTWTDMAQNFSDAASAARGGLLEWQTSEEFHPNVALALRDLATNQVTDPIETDEGIYVILLREKREAPGVVAEASDPEVTLHQLHLSVPQGADIATVTSAINRARAMTQSAANCGDLSQVGTQGGSPLSGALGTFRTSQLSPQLRTSVTNLVISTPSEPIRTADGVIVLMVCERSGVVDDPLAAARERIRLQLLNERLGRLAQQHEEKLRRDAFIDIRM